MPDLDFRFIDIGSVFLKGWVHIQKDLIVLQRTDLLQPPCGMLLLHPDQPLLLQHADVRGQGSLGYSQFLRKFTQVHLFI